MGRPKKETTETPEQEIRPVKEEMKPNKTAAVPLELLDSNPYNPRPINQKHVEELMEIITNNRFGVVQIPILVRACGERFEIINGHHRKEALKNLGYTKAVVSIADMGDENAAMSVFTSNRSLALDMLACGRHYLALKKAGLTKDGEQSKYASAIGKTDSYVSQSVKAVGCYNSLPAEQQKAINERNGNGIATHLVQVARAPQGVQEAIVAKILDLDLTVSQVKDIVDRAIDDYAIASEMNKESDKGDIDMALSEAITDSPAPKKKKEKQTKDDLPFEEVPADDVLSGNVKYLQQTAESALETARKLVEMDIAAFLDDVDIQERLADSYGYLTQAVSILKDLMVTE